MFQLFKFPAKRNVSTSANDSGAVVAQVAPIYHDGQAESKTAVDRLMDRIDYYMHCELDVEYDHERPEMARQQLRVALQRELDLARVTDVASDFSAMQPANDAGLQPAVN